MRASDTSELHFSEVEVPLENLIGEVEGEGFYQLMAVFNRSRVTVSVINVGLPRGDWKRRFNTQNRESNLEARSAVFKGFSSSWLRWRVGLKQRERSAIRRRR